MKYLKIGDDQIPSIGLGTWKSEKDKVYNAIRHAINVGYRHIDAAAIYTNEKEVGQAIVDAISAGDVTREDLWITSKLWNDAHLKSDVPLALDKSLKDLKLDYLDLYLVHWPVAFTPKTSFAKTRDQYLTLADAPLEETWQAMLDARSSGRTKHVGVCNFKKDDIELIANATGVYPEMLQIEAHPYLKQGELLTYTQEKDIAFTAYSPIGSGNNGLFNDEMITDLAAKHDATPAQIMLAWAIHRGTIPIPKSSNEKRIEENLVATKIKLEEEEIRRMDTLDKGIRYVDGTFFTSEESPYTLEQIWGEYK